MPNDRLKQFSQGFNRDIDRSVWDRLKGIISPSQPQQDIPVPNPSNIDRRTSMNEPSTVNMNDEDLRRKVFAQLALERLRNPGDEV